MVGYYGVGIEAALDEAERIRCPLTLHVAELDAFCPPEARQRIVQALGGRPRVAVHVYPGWTTPSRARAATISTAPRP